MPINALFCAVSLFLTIRVAATDAKLLYDVLVYPRNDRERRGEAQRHDEPGDVCPRKDEGQDGGAVAAVPEVWPVPRGVVERGAIEAAKCKAETAEIITVSSNKRCIVADPKTDMPYRA